MTNENLDVNVFEVRFRHISIQKLSITSKRGWKGERYIAVPHKWFNSGVYDSNRAKNSRLLRLIGTNYEADKILGRNPEFTIKDVWLSHKSVNFLVAESLEDLDIVKSI